MATKRVFLPWVHAQSPEYAILKTGMPKGTIGVLARVAFGRPIADAYVEDMVLDLEPGSGRFLPDSLDNTGNVYIVSGRLRDLLSATGASFEFLPVRIRNHKKRVEKAPYYLANLLESIDCMDKARSDFDPSEFDESEAFTIRSLVLAPKKIPDEAKIFRLRSLPSLFLVRSDLADEITRVKKFEGMLFKDIERYGEEFRPPDPNEE